jgi:hypothetical protein
MIELCILMLESQLNHFLDFSFLHVDLLSKMILQFGKEIQVQQHEVGDMVGDPIQ